MPEEATSSRPREISLHSSTDGAVQSTFESSPSKSVADFPASEPVGPSTSAATSELEAKLRQRMLKCEGSDVLYRPQSAKSCEKGASRTPARLKHSILKKNMTMMEPSKAHHLNVQDPSKVDELVETASYQRCTKARARSAHSLTRVMKKALASNEGSELQSEDSLASTGKSLPLHVRPLVRSMSAKAAGDVHVSLADEDNPDEASPELPHELSSPELGLACRGGAHAHGRHEPLDPALEQLLTPRSACSSSSASSDYGSVDSQYEFFELGTESGCATFALDDPTRDAMEETGDDIGSPRMLDSEKGDEDLEDVPEGDISIEECLFDLVNHIPSHLTQKIGLVLQHLEEVKRSGIAFAQRPLEGDEDGTAYAELEDGAEPPLEGRVAGPEAPGPPREAAPAPAREAGRPRPQKQAPLAVLTLHKRDCADCKQRQRQLVQHQESAKMAEEALEQQMRNEVSMMSMHAKAMSDELAESRREEDCLEQARREADRRLEMQKLRATAELEVLRTALAGADSRLIDAGARLQLTEQHRDHLRSEVTSSENELVSLRGTARRADERLQLMEQQGTLLRSEVLEGRESRRKLENEVQAIAARNDEVREQLTAEVASAARQDEMASMIAELEVVKRRHRDTRSQLEASMLRQDELQREAARGESMSQQLETEVQASATKEETGRMELESEMSSALGAAEELIQSRTAEVQKLHVQIEELQSANQQADMLRGDIQAEREKFEKFKCDAKQHEQELRLMAQRAMAEAEDLNRLAAIANESREQGRRHEEVLASELSSVVCERDHLRLELGREHAELLDEREESIALYAKNEDLREDRERLHNESVQQRKLLEAREAEVAVAHGLLARSGEREKQVISKYEEDCEIMETEVQALRQEQERFKALSAEVARKEEGRSDLALCLAQKDSELKEEMQIERLQLVACKSEMAECSELQKHLESERIKVQDESMRRAYLERVTSNLAQEKDRITCRYAEAMSEIVAHREKEDQLNRQVANLRWRLEQEQEELRLEQQSRSRVLAEAKEMETSKAQLEAQLELEVGRMRDVMSLAEHQGYWGGHSAGSKSTSRGGGNHRLHQNMLRESDHFADSTARVVQLEEVCRAADAEVAAQAQALKVNDDLRRQLCAETKYAVHEAEELRVAMDVRAAAQSEELREAEVRREQLEAETSLMAMEVATLSKEWREGRENSKDLGGRLLEDGALGLTRRPFTIHDILREAWRTGSLPPADTAFRPPAIADNPERGKAARDAYFVNLYLKWLRRGPYRHRLHITGMPVCSHPSPRPLPSHVSRGGVKGLMNHSRSG